MDSNNQGANSEEPCGLSRTACTTDLQVRSATPRSELQIRSPSGDRWLLWSEAPSAPRHRSPTPHNHPQISGT